LKNAECVDGIGIIYCVASTELKQEHDFIIITYYYIITNVSVSIIILKKCALDEYIVCMLESMQNEFSRLLLLLL